MFKKLLIAFPLMALLQCASQKQNINSELSKLFFNVDVTDLNTTLLDKFSSDTALHKDTTFRRLDNNNSASISQYIFKFENNKDIRFQFLKGYLGVIVGSDHKDTTSDVLYLALSFEKKSDLDTAYFLLARRFKNFGQSEMQPALMQTKSTVITNAQYDKRVEIIKSSDLPDQHLLYLYVKKSKK